MIKTNLEERIYEVAVELKNTFTNLHEEGNEQFHDYLIDRDFPAKREYIEYLIGNGVLKEELREPAKDFLHLAIEDINDNPFQRDYLYEQGSEYFPEYRYFIPTTKELMGAIEKYYVEDEPLGYIPSYEDYLYKLEQDGIEVSDDFIKGYYKAIELYNL